MPHTCSESDRAFRVQWEAGQIAAEDFGHRAHVRLAYVYLTDRDVEATHEMVHQTLMAFLRRQGVDVSKYHETMTRAWILAVQHFMQHSADTESFDTFIEQNPQLLDSRIMLTHYSADVLFSPEARARFTEPNLSPIPRYGEKPGP